MKIALPSYQNKIDDHFGHCEYFSIYTVDTTKKEILNFETLKSSEGCGCKSNIAQTLSQMGVKIMLAGNMGEGAVKVLNQSGIDVLRGCSGDTKTVVLNWLEGALADSGASCSQHNCNS